MPTPEADRTGVLFVCMGNICRSPLAEGVFLHRLSERGLSDRFLVDSCGTGGWHAGDRPDPRSIAVAKQHGIELPGRARRVDPTDDFTRFDLIVPMDDENLRELLDAGAPGPRTTLLRAFDPALPDATAHNAPPVPDPYYGGDDGFDRVFEMVNAACVGLLDRLARPA